MPLPSSAPDSSEQEQKPRRRRGWRVWFARVFAMLALGGAVTAVLIAVDSVHGKHEVSQSEARQAMNQLTVANRNLSRTLAALRPGEHPQQAQEASRSAAALSRKLAEDVGKQGDLGDGVHQVITAELAYLDAIGSTLNNPRSPLRAKIMERGIALRTVLQNLPGGAPRAVSGGAALVAYSKARVSKP